MPGGRPKIEIDYELCKKLAQIFCTQKEIAAVLGVSASTLEHDQEFLRIHKEGLETAKASLRRKQWKLADKNALMAIFLGKNYLGQVNEPDKTLGEDAADHFKEIARAIRKVDTDTD